MKKKILKLMVSIIFIGGCSLGFSQVVNANTELTEKASFSEVKEYLFDYFEENGLYFEENSSELYYYLFEQLNNNADTHLKNDKNYEYILAYAANFVSNYAELEINPANNNEDSIIEEVALENSESIQSAIDEGSMTIQPRAAYYNKNNAISYARKHAIWQNDNYPYFTADCTNFVSQAINSGGLPQSTKNNQSGMPWYCKKNAWNSLYKFDYSVPWINAHQFVVYWAAQGKRLSTQTTTSGVQSNANVGDVLAYQSKSKPYTFWHLAIVTKKEKGKIYVTQHSVSLKDADWASRKLDMKNNTVTIVKF